MKTIAAYSLIFQTLTTAFCATASIDLSSVRRDFSANIQIFVGDSVAWRNDIDGPAHVESFTGEFKSPIFYASESYSFTFAKPGRYLYQLITYTGKAPTPTPSSTNIASVIVQPLPGDRPRISIISPPDNFIVYVAPYEAIVSDSAEPLLSVNFFRDGEFIGAATSAPYRVQVPAPPGLHQIWTESVDATGRTNSSPRITLTHVDSVAHLTFNPIYIPNVGFAFNYVTSSFFQPLLFRSDDLKNWSLSYDGLRGHALILLPQTNLHHAFFYVRRGPS
jgi:hypothetical protein